MLSSSVISSYLAAILFLSSYPGLSQISLVKDINNTGNAGSFPNHFVASAGQLFFLANDGEHGGELWVTNGTTAGTYLVSDINPGGASGISASAPMVMHDGKLFFLANDGQHGTELWVSNSTQAAMVEDMRPGPDSNHIFHLTRINNRLIFQANPVPGDVEWWKVDNDNSVSLVKEIRSGPSGAGLGQPLVGDNHVFFEASDGSSPVSQLWVTDGTEAGTLSVHPEMDVGAGGGVSFNGYVFFFAQVPGYDGFELFKADASGATMVRNINTEEFGSAQPKAVDFHGIVYKGHLYFNAYDPVHADALWKTDGTDAGTVMVKDIYPGSNQEKGIIGAMTIFNDYIYFVAEDESTGLDLWRTNGTASGTIKIKDFLGVSGGFHEVDQKLYFIGNDGEHGNELWESDGTETGTKMVEDFAPGVANGISQLIAFENKIFLAANGPAGNELYVYTPLSCAPPEISEHPVGGTVNEGDDFTFTVSAAGDLSYQWTKDGIIVPGAASSSFAVVDATSADAGVYLCRVTNGCTTVSSEAATLVVDEIILRAEKQRADHLSLFPNPAKDWCHLDLEEAAHVNRPVTIRIIDNAGVLVREVSVPSYTIILDLSGLPAGIYTVTTQIAGQEPGVKRLVVRP